MSKIKNIFIPIMTIIFFIYVSSVMANAAPILENNLLLSEAFERVCSVNGQLIYNVYTDDFGLNYYSYNPKNKKSNFLGKVPTVGKFSGDYLLVSNRYLFSCIPVDKRITKDAKILERSDEVIRLMCIDLEKGKTTEVSRFSGISDFAYLEMIDEDRILVYGRFAEDSGVIKSYVDEFNFKDKKWNTIITLENRKISAATYDQGNIYVITEDWGASWPYDMDQGRNPVYSLNRYDETGKIIDEKTLEVNSLFPREEGSEIMYRSFMDLSVSGNYFKLNTFGSESLLFTFTDGVFTSLYAGERLTCWNNFSDGFKAKIVYLRNLSGDAYVLTKETNSLVNQQKRTTKVPIVNELWDGKSDYVFATMRSIDMREPTYVTVPISELF